MVVRETILVSAALAQRPSRAGHAWMVLNWLGAFASTGHDVVFVDRMDPSLGDVDGGVRWVSAVAEAAGVPWTVLLADGRTAGLSRPSLLSHSRGSLLLNVMGYLDDADVLASVDRRVFLDIDPGFGQAWQQAGTATPFVGHDAYATVGLNVGRPGCPVPGLGLDWITTFPPVDLGRWTATPPPPSGPFTTVAAWRGPFAPIEIDGRVHGLRVHEARRYAELPALVRRRLEMALDIDPEDDEDRRRLLTGGWRLRAPDTVAADLDDYQRYLSSSLAELTIAKQAYVTLQTGWFSDRSVCYLATGRPVIVSDTGLAGHLPVGEGLLTFSDPDEAAAAIDDVAASPARHGKAARGLAEEFFDGRRVARQLIERMS